MLLEKIAALSLDIPVISIDIPGAAYDAPRAYRDQLRRALGFSAHVEPAANVDDKTAALGRALAHLRRGAVITGIRASQTENRAGRAFVEWNVATGAIHINPLLDWPDAKTDFYLQNLPDTLRHPAYRPGVRAQGGRILEDTEAKEECGLHVFAPADVSLPGRHI